MKHLRKAVRMLLLVPVMLMSLATTAFAASPAITFTGFTGSFDFQPGSEYTETDLFNNFKGVMPGDVLTEEITFTNSAADCDFINLYMRAEAHDGTSNPLSQNVAESGETAATMTDFLSQLSMKIWNGTELIYNASPDELDGLKENKLLGTFRTGNTATFRVELTVPKELGNEYANRIGEVDWIFHVEAYNESQRSVRKIWSDGNANHANDNITVNLLKDGKVEKSQVLDAGNGWAYTFDKLVEGHTWTVEEASIPAGYTVSYDTVGTMTTITNTLIPLPSEKIDVGVEKVWINNGHAQPDSASVQLYRDNVLYDTVTLNNANGWKNTWNNLSKNANWSLREINTPTDYHATYEINGNNTVITNTYSPGTSPAPAETSLAVNKVWKDDGSGRPDSVTVELLRNGRTEASEKLSSANGWSYVWENLDASYSWSVAERDVFDSYDVSYETVGTTTTITNTKRSTPSHPIDLSAKKVWSSDDLKARPDSVTVTLYDGETAAETVSLGEWNNWKHTWTNLSSSGNWQIIETNIPKGYTPSYKMINDTMTITNTRTLIQTGQLNWPILAFGGAGLILVSLGGIMTAKKKKRDNA